MKTVNWNWKVALFVHFYWPFVNSKMRHVLDPYQNKSRTGWYKAIRRILGWIHFRLKSYHWKTMLWFKIWSHLRFGSWRLGWLQQFFRCPNFFWFSWYSPFPFLSSSEVSVSDSSLPDLFSELFDFSELFVPESESESDPDPLQKKQQLSCLMTKPTKWSVCPVKTQISLGICRVWSESSLSAWQKLRSLAQWRLWSDWADAHANPF